VTERIYVEVVRMAGRGDHFTALRSDGTRASWVVPSYHAAVPHDLVHLVVEAAFTLTQGFWGRVARGADPASLNTARARPALGWKDGASIELLQAEGLTAIHWYDPDVSVEARAADITESCAAFGVPPPPTMNATTIAETSAALRALRAALRTPDASAPWSAHYDAASPRGSFERLRDALCHSLA
jgi:hypothetical protein